MRANVWAQNHAYLADNKDDLLTVDLLGDDVGRDKVCQHLGHCRLADLAVQVADQVVYGRTQPEQVYRRDRLRSPFWHRVRVSKHVLTLYGRFILRR